MALDEQRAALRVEPEGEQRRPPSRASARAGRRGRGCSSARGSRRCSRSPRTRTAADVVADRAQVVAEVDDPGRLDPGEDPRLRRRAPRVALGRERGRSSWLGECSRRHAADGRQPGGRSDAVGYHSARCRRPDRPQSMSGARAARRRPRRGHGRRARSCAPCSSAPTTSTPSDGARARADRRRRPRPRPGARRPGCPPSS